MGGGYLITTVSDDDLATLTFEAQLIRSHAAPKAMTLTSHQGLIEARLDNRTGGADRLGGFIRHDVSLWEEDRRLAFAGRLVGPVTDGERH